MRILIAARFGKTSGIDTYTRNLAQALQENGHEVITAHRTRTSSGPGSAGEIVQIGEPNRPVRRLIGPLESIAAHRVLRQVARSRECAVVHATYSEFVFAGPPPVVVTAWHPLSNWLRRSITARSRSERFRSEALYALSDRRAYRRAGVVAISQAAQRDVRRRRQQAEWIPPFIPDRLIRPSNPKRSLSCTFIARWLDAPRKGLDLAIAATSLVAAEMPGLQLQLVGGWRDSAMAGRLPSHCVALGLCSPEEVSELLGASGCCVISSRWEEFGYSGLEALAAGTPLACTPLPGFEGLGSDGIVVAGRRDPASLAEAIRTALEIESFDFPVSCRSSVAIAQLEKLYFELAGDRS